MSQDPLAILFVTAVSVYVGRLWLQDYAAQKGGTPNPGAFPGATRVTFPVVLFGCIGAIALVLLETVGEYALGISAEQSSVTWLFLLGMVSAGFLEELIFRGYAVVEGRGRALLVVSIVGFSFLFALLHFHWAEWTGREAGWFELTLTRAAGWWTLVLFATSLFFYGLRFCKWNPERSLIPCFAAHIAGNVAVFVVKLAQGFVVDLY